MNRDIWLDPQVRGIIDEANQRLEDLGAVCYFEPVHVAGDGSAAALFVAATPARNEGERRGRLDRCRAD